MNGAAAEHIREGIPVLASYCDALGVRAFAEGKDLAADLRETLFGMIDALCDKPLINLESAHEPSLPGARRLAHPGRARACRAARRFVLCWVWHPRALPLAVPAATLHMAAMRGMEVVVARPEGFALPPPIMDKARARRAAAGGSVTRDRGPRRGARGRARACTPRNGARTSALRRCRGRCAPARRTRRLVRARDAGSRTRRPDAKLMHCLPVRRNSRSPTKCWTGRAQSCSARPSTAWSCRWPFCTACWPDGMPAEHPMIMSRPDPSVAVRALKSAAPYIRMYKNKIFVIKAGGAVFGDEALDARADRTGRDPAPGRHQGRARARRRPAARQRAGGARHRDAHGERPARHRPEVHRCDRDGAQRPDQHPHPRRSAANSTSRRSASAASTPAWCARTSARRCRSRPARARPWTTASSATSTRSIAAVIEKLLDDGLMPVVSPLSADAQRHAAQHQRRHRGRGHRRRARGREAGAVHRRAGHPRAGSMIRAR